MVGMNLLPPVRGGTLLFGRKGSAAVTSNQSLPSKLTRTPKSESFVFPPSLPNSNYPSAVDSYLPTGHPVRDIPPPEPGGSIVVVPQNIRTPVTGREVLNLEKPLLRHNVLLSYPPSSSILYPRFLHSEDGCTAAAVPVRYGDGPVGIVPRDRPSAVYLLLPVAVAGSAPSAPSAASASARRRDRGKG